MNEDLRQVLSHPFSEAPRRWTLEEIEAAIGIACEGSEGYELTEDWTNRFRSAITKGGTHERRPKASSSR